MTPPRKNFRKGLMRSIRVILAFSVVFFFEPRADAFFNMAAVRRVFMPPKFIQEAGTAFNTTASPKTTASFNVQGGDLLVAYLVNESYTGTSSTISGGGLTWTPRVQIMTTNYTEVAIWTAVVDTAKSMTVSFARAGGTVQFGGKVLTFRNAGGVGAVASTTTLSGAPSLSITTQSNKSAVVVANGDWAGQDGSTRVWRLSATETTYVYSSGAYVAYGGYHADIGNAGTYDVGISTPAGQKYAIGAIEVLGSGLAPSGECTTTIGTVCSDGSVYAGLSPDGNVPMYTTPLDAGSYSWNNGNTTGTVATGRTSAITGAANSAAIAVADADSGTGGTQNHQAAKHCEDLVAHGKSDWYLPAQNELNVLYTNRAAVGNFNTTGGEYGGSWYWSSTESSSGNAALQRFENGTQANWGKSYAKSIRCVRK